MKKYISLLLIATLSPAAFATCEELLPKGAAAPNFFNPRVYMCEGSVGGAETYAEGDRLAKEKALADAANFREIANCRQLGLDQMRKQFSFCNPMSACTHFTTILYFSCEPGESR